MKLIQKIVFKKVLCIVVFGVSTVSSFASDRLDKIEALMNAQGLVEIFEQQLTVSQIESRAQANQMLAQLMNGLNPNAKDRAQFTEALDEFVAALQPPWNAKEVVQVWARYYGEQFTDSELDQLLVYYTSPLAQKEVGASRKALTQFTQHFHEQYRAIMRSATDKYIVRLKSIAQACKCSK